MNKIRIYFLSTCTEANYYEFEKVTKYIRFCSIPGNIEKILSNINENHPYILIINDSGFSKCFLFNIINRLLKTPAGIKTIIYTDSCDPVYLESLIIKGIRGILHKNTTKKIIIEAITLINAGGIYIDNLVAFSIFKHKLKGKMMNNLITKILSDREKAVLSLISQGFENKAIAAKLYLSVKTVEDYKEKIKKKLGIKSVKELYELKL